MEKNVFENLSLSQFAQYASVPIAIMWTASFACQMFSFHHPLLGVAGNVIGLYSLFRLSRLVALYRHFASACSLWRCFLVALLTCLLCTLITSLLQCLYFSFLDGGRMLGTFMQQMEQPEFEDAWNQMQLGVSLQELKDSLSGITLSDIMSSLLFFNVFISLLFATLAVPLCLLWRITPRGNNDNTNDNDNE